MVLVELKPKKQANELSDKLLEIFLSVQIVFVPMLLNQQTERQESTVIGHLKSTVYRPGNNYLNLDLVIVH